MSSICASFVTFFSPVPDLEKPVLFLESTEYTYDSILPNFSSTGFVSSNFGEKEDNFGEKEVTGPWHSLVHESSAKSGL